MEHDLQVIVSDPTLRDGNHAIAQQLSLQQIRDYATAANAAGVPILEVGHGNGLGASSMQVGLSKETDQAMLETARECLTASRLAAFILPGWGTIKDIRVAIKSGVDIVRVAAHCTESDLTERHLGFLRDENIEAHGVMLMSHMATPDQLAKEAAAMVKYGAQAVGIYDSSGHYLPENVTERISAICSAVDVPVLFHGHNNLGMAVANSIAAVKAGAKMVDACARGFGAGAGNTQIEALVAVLHRMSYQTGIDLYRLLDAADIVEKQLIQKLPYISSESIVSGLSGVFSGFRTKVIAAALKTNVDARDIFFELGKRQAVAGQEDLIMDVAYDLHQKTQEISYT